MPQIFSIVCWALHELDSFTSSSALFTSTCQPCWPSCSVSRSSRHFLPGGKVISTSSQTLFPGQEHGLLLTSPFHAEKFGSSSDFWTWQRYTTCAQAQLGPPNAFTTVGNILFVGYFIALAQLLLR